MTKYDEAMKELNLTPEARERIIANVCEAVDDNKKAVRARRGNIRRYLTLAACCVLVITGAVAASRTGLTDGLMGGDSSDLAYDEEKMEAANDSERQLSEEPAEGGPEAGVMTDQPDQVDQDSKGLTIAGNSAIDKGSDMDFGNSGIMDVNYFESLEELNDYLGFEIDPGIFEKICLDEGLTEISYAAYGDSVGEIRYDDGNTENYYRVGSNVDTLVWETDDKNHDRSVEFDGKELSGSLSGTGDSYTTATWSVKDGFKYAAYAADGLSESKWNDIIYQTVEEGDK